MVSFVVYLNKNFFQGFIKNQKIVVSSIVIVHFKNI